MPHSPPPLPFSPVSSLQQPHSKIKAVLRSIISRGLAAFSVRSFACRYSALVTSPPSPLPLLGFCVSNQRYRPRQPAAFALPAPRQPSHIIEHFTPPTATSLPTSRALSPTLLRELYPKARPCNESQPQDPLPPHAVPLPQRHDSRRKSHLCGYKQAPPSRLGSLHPAETGTSTSTTPCICGIRARRAVRTGELQAVPTGP